MKVIQPDYIKNFVCDGKICDSRCCRDWQIADGENILQLDEHGNCQNLDSDFLCRLQKNFGENALPAVCQTYPRVIYKLAENIFEQSLTLTCPVAAQIILMRNAPIEFVEASEIKSRFIIDYTKKLSLPPEKFLQVQAAAIKILQDKNFSIDERLQNLCEFFYKKISAQKNLNLHADNLIKIFSDMYGANLSNQKKNILCRNYLNNRENILSNCALENYLANEFFMRCYPCAFIGDNWLNCKIFVIGYRILEFSVVLTAIADKNFDLINLICAVNDKLDHSKGGMTAIINFAENISDEDFFASMI